MEKPKYKLNDRVTFTLGNKVIIGTIAIVDVHGTWENPTEPSYDILGIENGTKILFKHIPESLVELCKN